MTTSELVLADDESAMIDRAIDLVVAAVDDVFTALERMGRHLAGTWQRAIDHDGAFDTGHLVELQACVFATLDEQASFESAGYVFAAGALADRDRHLDWWHRLDGDGYEFLVLELDPGAADCYDYYEMDWFRAALDARRRFVSGPLIDLPCADVYIMTFSSPVVVADRRGVDRLLGVAGADVAISRFERRIVPPLRSLPRRAVLVNSERRVIASNVAEFTTGEKLARVLDAVPEWSTVRAVTADLGWSLAVADLDR